jgi:putative restriction endonuclease
MSEPLSYYLNKIEHLRVDRTHNVPAPHKPLLLLTVLDLIERGEITQNRIEVSPLLVETYLNYWKHIPTGQPRLYNPFPRLRTSGFWHLHPRPSQKSALAATRSFQSLAHLNKLVAYASFDPELFLLLQRHEVREVLRQTIIKRHLAHYRPLVESAASENHLIGEEAQKLRQHVTSGNPEDEGTPSPARSVAFRQEIMRLYDYTCSACRLRIITPDGRSVVDAAHIIPFSESYDDGIGNGLALCKLHHWAFDAGLLSLTDRYRLLISNAFEERGHAGLLLRNLEAKPILLPSQKPFYPSLHALRWHRSYRFQA